MSKVAALAWMSLTTEKPDVLSAKCLQFKDTPFDKLLMSIEKNNDPQIEPWGTPELGFSEDEIF